MSTYYFSFSGQNPQSPFPLAGAPPVCPITGPTSTAGSCSSLVRYHSRITISRNANGVTSSTSVRLGIHFSSHSSFYSTQILQVWFGSADTFFCLEWTDTRTVRGGRRGQEEVVAVLVSCLSSVANLARRYLRSPSCRVQINNYLIIQCSITRLTLLCNILSCNHSKSHNQMIRYLSFIRP